MSMTKKHDRSASHLDFTGTFDVFTCLLAKHVLKRRFLESCLSKIFTVSNFGNILAMTIILFFSKG